MNLLHLALATSRANPSVARAEDETDELIKKYNQLVERYNQLVTDCKNLQESVRYEAERCKVLSDALFSISESMSEPICAKYSKSTLDNLEK